VARGRAFEEDLVVADVDADAVARARLHDTRRRRARRVLERRGVTVDRVVLSARYRATHRRPAHGGLPAVPSPLEEVYRALVLGISDYARKNRFAKLVLGLSGGIDSSLSAVLATDAMGAPNVVGVFMPSPYSSDESREDAQALAQNLEIRFLTVPITPIFQAYTAILAPAFKGRPTRSFPSACSPGLQRPNCVPTRRTRTPFLPTKSSIPSFGDTWRRIRASPTWSLPASIAVRWSTLSRSWTAANTSAGNRRLG